MAYYPVTAVSTPIASGTANLTQVTVGTTAMILLAANPNRLGVSIFNTSNKKIWVGFTNTISSTVYAFMIPSSSLFEWAQKAVYTGNIHVIGESAGLLINVTQYLP